MFVLKLPRFFTRLYGEGKRAVISKLTYIWTLLSRSYIVFALVLTKKRPFNIFEMQSFARETSHLWKMHFQ